MSEPKLHHTVPRFLLARFAGGDGALELIDRDDFRRVIPSAVPVALAVRHFYSRQTPSGARDTRVEKMLSTKIEGPAAEAIRRLVDRGRSIAGMGIRTPIGLFLAYQTVRGTGQRRATTDIHNLATRVAVATAPVPVEVGEHRGPPISERDIVEVLELAQSGKYEVVRQRAADLHLDSFGQAIEIARVLEARTWQLLEFRDPVLATCDEPVLHIGHNVHVPGDLVGLANAAAVAFTFDPRHALMMVRPDLDRGHRRVGGSSEEAKVINTHVAFNAHRFIVRRPGTDPLAGLVVPKKAPLTATLGNLVVTFPGGVSEATHARVMAQLKRERAARQRDGGRTR
jgi:hypothetical protein